jgi:hypothetical protein
VNGVLTSSGERFTPSPVQSQGTPHKQEQYRPAMVDTSTLKVGYGGGASFAYSLNETKPAVHVDMRARQGKHDVGMQASQLRPIKWDKERGYQAAEEFLKHYDPSRLTWEEIRVHVALMLERLRFQRDHYKCTGPTPERMVELSLLKGPEFTAEWASAWKEGRFNWAGTERVEPVIDEKRGCEFVSYNSTYTPFFFIFWEEDVEDYLHMFQGKPYLDAETLIDLEHTVAELSEELLPSGNFSVPDEVTWQPVSTNAYDSYGEKTRPEWEIEYDNPKDDYIADHLLFVRGMARKRPSETRDIGTMAPPSRRMHRRIMYPLQQACQKIKGCVYGKDITYIRKVVRDAGESCRYFFMRDYTKSGMTMPTEVRMAILRGFYRRSPELAEKYCKAFSNLVMHLKQPDGVTHSRVPDTGTPLGMFVEGFTLLQYAIDRMVRSSLNGKFVFNATNDDMFTGCNNLELLETYVFRDLDINRDLGMRVKASKSGISTDRFFYCEEYWDGEQLMSKECLVSMAVIGAKYALNIVHAKELVNSTLLALAYISDTVRLAVRTVISSYGHEFTESESSWPYLFGGWWPQYRDGLDSSIEWRNGDALADIAYWACREEPKKRNKLQEKPALAYARLKGMTLIRRPEIHVHHTSLIPFFGTKGALTDYFSLISRKPAVMRRYYQAKYIARQRYFIRALEGKQDTPSVVYGYLRRHPNSVILPGMAGVRYCKADTWVHKPKIGLASSNTDLVLRLWSDLGYIDCPNLSPCSNAVKRLTKIGITEELKYQSLALSNDHGISCILLSKEYRGLLEFQRKYGLTILQVDDDDRPLELSKHWTYLPRMPLMLFDRIGRLGRPLGPKYELCLETSHLWERIVQGIPGAIDWDAMQSQDIEEETKVDPFETRFEENYLDTLRLLLDMANVEIKAKIAPLSEHPDFRGTIIPPRPGEDQKPDGYFMVEEGSFVPLHSDEQRDFWDNSSDSDAYGVLEM